MVFSFISKWN